MQIALVYKTGGDYNSEYVRRICASVDHPVVCLTDSPRSVEKFCTPVPLRHRWPGWWSKIELFRPGLWEGRVLYLDLDTVALARDLSHLGRDEFTMLRDFFQPSRPASGVMAWRGDAGRSVYRSFLKAPPQHMALHRRLGDGGFISKTLPPSGYFGDSVQSAKVEGDRGAADLVCFHGRPRPHTVGWDFTRVPTRSKPI